MGDVKCLLWVRRSGGLPLGAIIVEVTVGGRGGAGERRDRGYEGAAWTPSEKREPFNQLDSGAFEFTF